MPISALIKFFQSLDEETLKNLEDVGPIVAKSIFDFWRDEHNLQLLEKFINNGVKLIIAGQPSQGLESGNTQKLAGQIFVLTGSLGGLTREEAKDRIKILGGKTKESVTRETNYVVVGVDPGSKYEKAKKLGIKILDGDSLLKLLS